MQILPLRVGNRRGRKSIRYRASWTLPFVDGTRGRRL